MVSAQSKSMIVGLGDYVGGEIVIEGTPHNILYNPIEFDGWKQIHYTFPFKGSRYSLVYFSHRKGPSFRSRFCG